LGLEEDGGGKVKAADALKKDWGDFLSANTTAPVRPDEMTSEIMAGETGKSRSRCQRILQELFIAGKAKRRRITINGAPGYAYKLKT
jgi:hypothetical protein